MKCCLRYEFDTYEEHQKELPPIGSEIVTSNGRAKVLNHEILTKQLLVQTEDSRRVMIEASDVLSVLSRGTPRKKSRDKRPPPETTETAPTEGKTDQQSDAGNESAAENNNTKTAPTDESNGPDKPNGNET